MARLVNTGVKEGKKSSTDYLTECYKMVSYFARWSKPLYVLAGGHMESLGGSLLASSLIPVICDNASLAFPEASITWYHIR